ncbi:hypothetical protein DMC47_20425 [Nostoc sp. 3335mG]|nr:hypothetical protein DMC47_20425 [Nostoc sp. 3335mG]
MADRNAGGVAPLAALAIEIAHGRRLSFLRILWLLFVVEGRPRVLSLIRCSQHAHLRSHRRLAKWLTRRLQRQYGCYIQPDSHIGPGLQLPHPQGIVIGSGVSIGANATIYHQVTLGGARAGDWKAGRYPRLGDGVVLFAGAKLIGAINIGDGALVGANAVVLADVPAGYRAVGIPARLILPTSKKSEEHPG